LFYKTKIKARCQRKLASAGDLLAHGRNFNRRFSQKNEAKKKKGPPLYVDFLNVKFLDVCKKEKHKLRPASEVKLGDIVVCSERQDFKNPTDIGRVMYVAPHGVITCA